MIDIKTAKRISIPSIMEVLEVDYKMKGTKRFYSSPFTSDSDPSMLWNEKDNTFFDFSTGKWGDAIQLMMDLFDITFKDALSRLDQFSKDKSCVYTDEFKKTAEAVKRPFDINKYLNVNRDELSIIRNYAESRRINKGYIPCFYWEYDDDNDDFIRVPAVGFKHYDDELNLSGIKMRRADGGNPRFQARGKLGFYICHNAYIKGSFNHTIYIMESETSANSLCEYLKAKEISAIILSIGSNTCVPDRIPPKILEAIGGSVYDIKLIIDYDGNEELYNERLERFSKLGAKSVRLILEKGEDINSLYCKDNIKLIENLL